MTLLREERAQADPSWEAYHGCRADTVNALRENITVRAYYLSRKVRWTIRRQTGCGPRPRQNSSAFVNGRSASRGRLDPCRE